MKLNHDCMRSVLLEIEKRLCYDDDMNLLPVPLDALYTLDKYTPQDIHYSVKMLSEAGYINYSGKFIYIIDIILIQV